MDNQLVVFELGDESFGVAISAVESIIKMQAITRVPHTPVFVEGLTNLRGKVLPVVDLRKRFSLPVSENLKDQRIVVISVGGLETGMIVDAVSEVLSITEDAVEPTPAMVMSIDTEFITGIAKIDGRLVILLNLDKVLCKREVEDLKKVSAMA